MHAHSPAAATPGWAEQVRRACAHRGLQLTGPRAGVVAVLAEHAGPLGAYAIIEALTKRENKPIAPPTVYRALDFLIEHGFLHRIESRNEFAPCAHLDHEHRGVLLSCQTCGRSVEIEDDGVGAAIDRAAHSAGFVAKGRVIEVAGLCEDCARRDG
ncbi:MAG: transcriptional repressor [Pseudomonadota bacterium]|nr:transcriptional repressor [Pseudomonadota bacterium]